MPTDLFDLSATISAKTQEFDSKINASKAAIQSLRDRIKELSKETDNPFRTAQADALKKRLEELVARHKALVAAQKESAASSAKHAQSLREIGTAATSIPGPLGSVASQLMSIGTAGGPVGIVATAVVALGAAAVGAAAGIFKMVEASADFAGKFKDLSQQTNFSVETLSALSLAAETSGGNIETIAASLGIFQRKLEEATDSSSKAAETFDKLGVTTTDNEQALRQTIDTLSKMTDKTKQTSLSLEVFGRSGRQIMALYKEAGGDLDAFIKKMSDQGLLVTTEMAERGDALSDSITRMGEQFGATGRQIADAFEPLVSDLLRRFSAWFEENKSEIVAWARSAADAATSVADAFTESARGIKMMWDWLASVLTPITATVQIVTLGGVESGGVTVGSLSNIWNRMTGEPPARPAPVGIPGLTVEAPMPGDVVAAQHPFTTPFPRLPGPRRTGGGGGGGGGRVKKEVDEYAEALKRMDKEVENAIKDTDQYGKEIERLIESLEKKKVVLTGDQKAQLENRAEQLRSIAAGKDYKDFMQSLKDELEEAGHSSDKWTKMLADEEKQLAKNHKSLKDFVGLEHEDLITRLRLVDAAKKEAEAMQQLVIVRQRYADILKNTRSRTVGVPEGAPFPIWDLGGGSIYGRDTRVPTPEEVLGSTRPRRVEPDQWKADWDKWKARAEELTYLLDDSIHEGFRNGIKAGMITFAQGILQMIESKILDKLSSAIADAIVGGVNKGTAAANGGGGGGSWWQKLLGIGLGALGSLAGGALSSAVSHSSAPAHTTSGTGGGGPHGSEGNLGGIHLASGLSFVPYDNYPALLHKGERVVPASENKPHPNVIFNVYAQDAQSFGSRETQRQISEKYRRAMARTALTA